MSAASSLRWLAALIALAACALAPAAAEAAGTVDLIVRRDAGLSAAERADVRADAGVTHDHNLRLADTEVVSVPADEAADALHELRADPDVRWAQRDAGVSAQATAGADPFWSVLWGLENTGQTVLGQTGIADADVDGPEAWQLSTGTGVTVAVVDTGVDANHEDLSSQLATNPGEMGGGRESNHADDDGDGLIDDWRGWDFVYGDNDPSDLKGHGTHVTGTIAARNANATGVSGLAPDAKVLMLKGLGDDGQGAWSGLADAFDFAGDQGIRVVNASLGGTGPVPVIDDVVAQHPNTLYVVAAGNDNRDLDTSTYYPCEAAAANVLCVGASDNRDLKAGFSNYSSTSATATSTARRWRPRTWRPSRRCSSHAIPRSPRLRSSRRSCSPRSPRISSGSMGTTAAAPTPASPLSSSTIRPTPTRTASPTRPTTARTRPTPARPTPTPTGSATRATAPRAGRTETSTASATSTTGAPQAPDRGRPAAAPPIPRRRS
jgi:hypothetical protein